MLLEPSQDSSNIIISVKDSGVGIDKEDINSIFDQYTVNSMVGTDGEIGTGLGLSITHAIVRSFNGEMLVESEKGIGSTFKVILPLVNARV